MSWFTNDWKRREYLEFLIMNESFTDDRGEQYICEKLIQFRIHIFNQIERSKSFIKQRYVWKYKLIKCDSLKKKVGNRQTDRISKGVGSRFASCNWKCPSFSCVLDGKHYIHISLETVHKQRLKSRYFKYFKNPIFHCWNWSDEKTEGQYFY